MSKTRKRLSDEEALYLGLKPNKHEKGRKNARYYLTNDQCKKLQSKYLTNTTLFISLEPCIMCAAAISEAHIGKVYFGAYDENIGGLENLSKIFKQNNLFLPEIYGGIHEKESLMLLKRFFKSKRK